MKALKMKAPDHTLLSWDTDFMNYKVYKIVGEALAKKEDLKTVLAHLKNEGAVLSYLFAAPADEELNQYALEQGGLLADRKVIFGHLHPHEARPVSPLEAFTGREVSAELLSLALQSGVYSRFNTDPHFKDKEYQRLYAEWIHKSVSGELADAIFVYKEAERLLGFVTVQKKAGTGQIGLIAVDETARGKGIGGKLIRQAHYWYGQQGCERAEVVTQLDNTPACELYKKAGYTIQQVQNIYHFWNR